MNMRQSVLRIPPRKPIKLILIRIHPTRSVAHPDANTAAEGVMVWSHSSKAKFNPVTSGKRMRYAVITGGYKREKKFCTLRDDSKDTNPKNMSQKTPRIIAFIASPEINPEDYYFSSKIRTMIKNIAIVSTLLFSFYLNPLYAQEFSEDFEQFGTWLSGDYTNAQQASANSDYGNLVLHIGRIWPDAETGIWMYMEEADAAMPEKPLRQRVLFLSEISDGEYSVDVYTIPDAASVKGAWKNPDLFDGKTAFDIKHLSGCAWFVNYDGFQYSGKSNTGSCKPLEGEAAYTTTEMVLLPNEFRMWERVFDADNKQLSGPAKEGLIFIKK